MRYFIIILILSVNILNANETLDSLVKIHNSNKADTLIIHEIIDKCYLQYVSNPELSIEIILDILNDESIELSSYLLTKAYNAIATNYWAKSDFSNSLKYSQLAEKLASENEDYPALISSMIQMGLSYANINNLDKSLLFHKKALSLIIETNDTFSLSNTYGNIG